jgi:hypothetical protein
MSKSKDEYDSDITSPGWTKVAKWVFVIVAVILAVGVCLLFSDLLPGGTFLSEERTTTVWFPIERMQSWSFSLGQISFGLAAAFAALIFPEIQRTFSSADLWRRRLRNSRIRFARELQGDYRLPVVAIQKLFSGKSAHRYFSDRELAHLSRSANRLLGKPGKITETQFANFAREIFRPLKYLLTHWSVWDDFVGAAEEQQPDGQASAFPIERIRPLILAEEICPALERAGSNVTKYSLFIVIVSFVTGAFALAPDPFFYVWFHGHIPNFNATSNGPNLMPDYLGALYPATALWAVVIFYGAFLLLAFYFLWRNHENIQLYAPEHYQDIKWNDDRRE